MGFFTDYSNMSDVGISNKPNQRWFRLLKAIVSQENPVLRRGLGHFSNDLLYIHFVLKQDI